MQLLEDVFIIEKLEILNEGKTSGPMKIRGCFQRAEEANNNKRIYRKPLLEREITKLATAMNERRLLGELDHPQNDSVRLSNVSHLITGLSMNGNEVIGEAEILNTPSGKVAQALIEGGVKVGISSRGMGTVTEELDGKRYVNEDFKLITWDIVADPSTRGAFPGLTESTQIQEIIDTVYPEAQKVKNFTTLLKEELVTEMDKPAALTKIFKANLAQQKPHKTRKLSDARNKNLAKEWEGAKKKREEGAAKEYNTSQQNSSTQFVNFMRDKLNEIRSQGVEVNPNVSRSGLDKKGRRPHGGPHNPLKPEDFAGWYDHKGKTKKQNSSTQFVNFMRDKLMEIHTPNYNPPHARHSTADKTPGSISRPEMEHPSSKRPYKEPPVSQAEYKRRRKGVSKANLARYKRYHYGTNKK